MIGVCKIASLSLCGIIISQGFVVTCEYVHSDFSIWKTS